jgi:hypothetical protein
MKEGCAVWAGAQLIGILIFLGIIIYILSQ